MAWAMKAMHPADIVTEVQGIPKRESDVSMCNDYRLSTVITPPAALPSNATWDCLIIGVPTPGSFGSATTFQSTGGILIPTQTMLLNAQLGITPSGHPEIDQQAAQHVLGANVRSWRPTHFGMTCELNAPEIANQGVVYTSQMLPRTDCRTAIERDQWTTTPNASSEKDVSDAMARARAARCPTTAGSSCCSRDSPNVGDSGHNRWSFPVTVTTRLTDGILGTYSADYSPARIMSYPSCYSGLAKNGCYCVYKLDDEATDYHKMSDCSIAAVANRTDLDAFGTFFGTTEVVQDFHPYVAQKNLWLPDPSGF